MDPIEPERGDDLAEHLRRVDEVRREKQGPRRVRRDIEDDDRENDG